MFRQIQDQFMEYVYPKFSDATAYSQSKQAIKSASDSAEAACRDVGTFKQLMQCCIFNRHFDDVLALINNLML